MSKQTVFLRRDDRWLLFGLLHNQFQPFRWRHQLSSWWQKILRGFALIWVACYNYLGPKLHIHMCDVIYVDSSGKKRFFKSYFSEKRFLVDFATFTQISYG